MEAASPKSCEFQTIKPGEHSERRQDANRGRIPPRSRASSSSPSNVRSIAGKMRTDSAGRYAPIELYGFVPCAAVTHVSGTTMPAASQSDGGDSERDAIVTPSATESTPRTLARIIADWARPHGDMKCRKGTSSQPYRLT